MKVLFLGPANNIHTIRWVNALTEKDLDVILVSIKNHKATIKTEEISSKVKVITLKYGGSISYYMNAFELKKIFDYEQPDLVNVHYASGYGTLARVSKINPCLLSVWGSDVYEFPYLKKLNKVIIKKNLAYANFVGATSEALKNQILKFVKDKIIYITPFGVDTKKFNRDWKPLKKKNEIVIGTVKTLSPKYGIDVLIRAVPKLIEIMPEEIMLRVEIYGKGEQKKELETLINQLNIQSVVKLKGYISNDLVPVVLSEFDIFCVTSYSESFGVAAVEAMAATLPVVATNADGLVEVVENNKTGIIVNTGHHEEVAMALNYLICNPIVRVEMGKKGYSKVQEKYNWDSNVDTMIHVYHVTAKSNQKE